MEHVYHAESTTICKTETVFQQDKIPNVIHGVKIKYVNAATILKYITLTTITFVRDEIQIVNYSTLRMDSVLFVHRIMNFKREIVLKHE